jgi:hypothetical protein
MKVQPLKTEAKWLSSKPSISRPAASSPDIETLVERFAEPLRGDRPASTTALVASGLRFDDGDGARQSPARKLVGAPAAAKKSGPPVKGLITALVGIALVPAAILFVLLWQEAMGPRSGHGMTLVEQKSTARLPDPADSAQAEQASSPLEVALSSPHHIEANAGEVIEFPLAIDATEALPARSIVAITALPQGASLSAGRPYGVTGWSLRPDEIGGLSLRLPAHGGASDMRLELVAGDGTVLAQSETQLSIAAPPAEVATVASIESDPFEQVARADQLPSVAPQSAEDSPPPPQRNPRATTASDPGVKVNTVKVVTIKPPQQTRPHDGAYALGSPADEAQAPAEWMETKTAVDMHAKAQQSSETVKVADTGLKLRVMARDKNWVQVTDPASSTTGWVYNRFLKPTDPPVQ